MRALILLSPIAGPALLLAMLGGLRLLAIQ
jgi:hypothetical protein